VQKCNIRRIAQWKRTYKAIIAMELRKKHWKIRGFQTYNEYGQSDQKQKHNLPKTINEHKKRTIKLLQS
jgi:hypothetical protein